ncbi:MAG: glycosyltransferase, partial [Thiohalospira sp.]
MGLTVVIPARNEAAALPVLLADLAPLRAAGAEVVVVDGGSRDGTPEL